MINKLLSGRYILTLVCAVVFVWATANKLLQAQAVSVIITMVFQAYFNRNDRNTPNQGGATA